MAAKVKLGCAVFAASFAVLACVPWAVGPEAGCTVSGSLGELTICSKVCPCHNWYEVPRPCYKKILTLLNSSTEKVDASC